MNSKGNTFFLTLVLLVASFTLMVLPLPHTVKWVWPHWVLLTVIYRVLTSPERYGIFFGFTIGVLVDLLLANKLGIHALSYSLICYCLLKIQHRIYLFPVFQQSILVFMLVLIDVAALSIFSSIKLNWIFVGHGVLAAMSTSIVWFIVIMIVGLRQQLSKIK